MNSQIIYLSGAIRAELAGDPRFGYLCTPNMGNKAAAGTWGADTGCFSKAGVSSFNFDAYLRWLRSRPAGSCVFATAPDVYADAAATITRSLSTLPAIAAAGFKRGFVGQDGLENLEVPWSEFDAFFLGGTTEWKLSLGAAVLAHEAKQRGKWVHMGRVKRACPELLQGRLIIRIIINSHTSPKEKDRMDLIIALIMTLWDWVDWIVAAYPLITLFAAFVLIALNGSQSYAAGWNAAMAYVHNNRDEVKRYWRENRD